MSRILRILPRRFQKAIESGMEVFFIQNWPRTSRSQRNAMPVRGASVWRPLRPWRSCGVVRAISMRTVTVCVPLVVMTASLVVVIAAELGRRVAERRLAGLDH